MVLSTSSVGVLLTTALAILLMCPQVATCLDPKEYYGGFYPTESWVQSLKPIPRGERPDPTATWISWLRCSRSIPRGFQPV